MFLPLYKTLNALVKAIAAGFLPPISCRYTPSCSRYAAEALKKYGPVKGGLLALWRLIRCHPFSPGGLDPVK
jgi:uncharacterized protein